MTLPVTTRVFVLQNPPVDDVVLSGPQATWSIEEKSLPALQEGQVLAEVVYFSNDPAQRTWIDANVDPERLYVSPVLAGQPMRAFGVLKVLASAATNLKEGDLVYGGCSWAKHHVLNAADLQVCKPDSKIGPTQYLGALGFTGGTAYVGLVTIGQTQASDTVVVNGAAGATGNMVVQIAKKILGCKRVIGLAGSDEKCRWVESLGADKCINYKGDWKQELKVATEGGVNVFFDNVGGEQLDFMLTRMARHGRVVVCGAIGNYNGVKHGMQNWFNVISMRLQLKGFLLFDHLSEYPKVVELLTDAAQSGKIRLEDTETIVDAAFEDIPKTWTMLFTGLNKGKLMTRLT